MNAALIRQLNIARVFHAIRVRPGVSQRELVAATGLDKATVSTVVGQLEEEELVVREARPSTGRAGRPEIGLALAAEAGLLVGAHLEPGTVRLLVTSLEGAPRAAVEVPGSSEVDRALDELVRGVARLLAGIDDGEARLRGVGVGIPALMDHGGRLVFAPNLGWRDVEVRAALEERMGRTVFVDNDTKAAGLAEKLFGACQHVDDFLFVAGHSGVGGALYLDGRLYRGHGGFAGEIGHVKVRPGGRRCSCGGEGCLEAYLSEASILRRLDERGVQVRDLRAVAEAADRREPAVLEVLDETGELLGLACADLANIFDPERVVLGGNVAVVAPYLLESVQGSLVRHALAPVRDGLRVEVSPLGTESVIMGGIALAMESFLSLPTWLAASQLRQGRSRA